MIARETRLAAPFLVYLVLITFAPVYHGVRVLATRHAPEQLRTPFHTVLHLADDRRIGRHARARVRRRARIVYARAQPDRLPDWIGQSRLRAHTLSVADDVVVRAHEVDDRRRRRVSHRVLRPRCGTPVRDLDGRLRAVLPWLLPTIVGVPVSAIWVAVLPAQVRGGQSRGRGSDELTEVTEGSARRTSGSFLDLVSFGVPRSAVLVPNEERWNGE